MEAVESRLLLSTINVLGNGQLITSGGTTVSAANFTNFGPADINNFAVTQTFTITDPDITTALNLTGATPVTITGANAADFTISAQPGSSTIAAGGGSTTFTISFKAKAFGDRKATINIVSDNAGSPFTFAIEGKGVPAIELSTTTSGAGTVIHAGNTPALSDFTDFGYTGINEPAFALTRTYVIENSGAGAINLTGTPVIRIGGTNAADFTVTMQPGLTAVDGTHQTAFTITFAPLTGHSGLLHATVSIDNDGPTNLFTYNIQGTAVATTLAPGGSATQIAQIAAGTGAISANGESIVVNYTGYLLDGTKFDSSLNAGHTPFNFKLGNGSVIMGWDKGMLNLQEGEQRVLLIPSAEAYGVSGSGSIPPNSNLIFVVQRLPQIEIFDQTGGAYISNNSNTPTTANHTDFGLVAPGASPITYYYGVSALNSPPQITPAGANFEFVISGPAASQFTASGLQQGTNGQSQTYTYFTVTFTPATNSGVQHATVSFSYNTVSAANVTTPEVYSFAIQGTVAPINVLGNGHAIITGSTTASAGNYTDMGATDLNSITLTRTYTISNTDPSLDLHLTGGSPVTISGANAADFIVSAQPGLGTVAAHGGSTTFTVTYHPSALGLSKAVVNIANDGLSGPYTFALQAQCLPAIELSSSPSGAGIVIHSGNTPATADRTDFGATDLGNAAHGVAHTFLLENSSGSAISLSGNPVITISGLGASDFTVTTQPAITTLDGAHRATFTITFAPEAGNLGMRRAVVSIGNINTGNGGSTTPYTFNVQGQALPVIELSTTTSNASTVIHTGNTPSSSDFTDFGYSRVSDAAFARTRSYLIENSGANAINLTGGALITIGGADAADFNVTTQPGVTMVDGTHQATFTITFAPGAGANALRSATVSIVNSGTINPFTFNIQGIALTTSLAGNNNVTQFAQITAGSGAVSIVGENIVVNYTGYLADGTKFDSSLNAGRTPFIFLLGPNPQKNNQNDVITGWEIGMLNLKQGEQRVLLIPAIEAFGVVGEPGSIPANSNLIFVVERLPQVEIYDGATGNYIVSGSTTTSTVDHTDFGAVAPGAGAITYSFGIAAPNTPPSIIPTASPNYVLVDGTGASHFVASGIKQGSNSQGQTYTYFTVTYVPGTASGVQHATISIPYDQVGANNHVTSAIYSFAVQGTVDVPPTITLVTTQSTLHDQPLTLPVTATAAHGGTLTYAATIQGPGAAAAAFRTSLGIIAYQSAYDNYYGQNERWFTESSGRWDYVLPDGTFNRVTATSGRTISAFTSLGILDTSYYAAPANLLTATAESSPVGTASWTGNQLTLTPTAHFAGTTLVTLNIGDGVMTGTSTFAWLVTNAAPIVTVIPDQTSVHGVLAPITVTATDANNDTLTYAATITGPGAIAAGVKNSAGLLAYVPGLDGYFGQSEKWFTDSTGHADFLLPDGTLRRAMATSGRTITGSTLLGTVATAYYAAPTSLLTAAAETTPVATASWAANVLTLAPTGSFTGSALVTVNVGDGVTVTPTTFRWNWNVTGTAPVITTIVDQTAVHDQSPAPITVTASAGSGDPLVYTATFTGPAAVAAALKSSVGLTAYISTIDNYYGQGEKWFTDSTGHADYLLPDGTLRRVTTVNGRTITGSTLLGTVDSRYYTAPASLLTAVAETSPVATGNWAGNMLTLTPALHVLGTTLVTVTVSDGVATATTTFHWTLTNLSPSVTGVGDQSSVHDRNLAPIPVTASDPNGDTLTYSATITGPGALAAALKRGVGLTAYISTIDNYYGQGEKWFTDSTGHADFLLPNGTLNRVTTVSGRTITGSTLLGSVDASYYAAPASLLTAIAESAPVATANWAGNVLTLTPALHLLGTTLVTVTVSDGVATDSTTFHWTLTNVAPTVAAITDQTSSHDQNLALITVSGADANTDTLTYTATIQGPAALAAALKNSVGLITYISTIDNYYGQNEKWFTDSTGHWDFLLSDGTLKRVTTVSGRTITGSTLLGTVDSRYYTAPASLLTAVAETSPVATGNWAGNMLTLTPALHVLGTTLVTVTVSDGVATATTTFHWTLTNAAPIIPSISSQTSVHDQPLGTITVNASDADGDTLTYSAVVKGPATLAVAVKNSAGLTSYLSTLNGYYGQNEKWFLDNTGHWDFLLPDGTLNRVVTVSGRTITSSAYLGTVDVSYYALPATLVTVTPENPPVGAASWSGNQMTLTPAAGFVGTTLVTITVSDGIVSNTQNFTWTVT